MTSLRILFRLVFPAILLSQLISATRILLPSSFRRHQHSDPYIRTGVRNALYSFIFVFVAILVISHILLNLPNIADARPILRLMSFVHCPSSVINPPKYTNTVTCSNSSPSNFAFRRVYRPATENDSQHDR